MEHYDVQVPWRREHDRPDTPIAIAPKVVHPRSLVELIALCRDHDPSERLHAAGSHWALSEAALSDHTFVETRDPDDVRPGLSATLRDVVPGCVSPAYLAWLQAGGQHGTLARYPFHVEAGKRLYECYSELDLGELWDPRSLASVLAAGGVSVPDSFALSTLGGAAGQTVAGAIGTGTHGGDFDRGPLADAVRAMHVVLDGGAHIWLEPPPASADEPVMTDDERLRNLYGGPELGGRENFRVVRDQETFDAVLVGVGRFGITYSVVLEAVPQHLIREQRSRTTWGAVRAQVNDPTSELYTADAGTGMPQRFLQIGVMLTGGAESADNAVGVTRRWDLPLGDLADPPGRAERRGSPEQPLVPGRPVVFENAGRTLPYAPDPDHPGHAAPPTFLLRAGEDPDIVRGAVREVVEDLEHVLGLGLSEPHLRDRLPDQRQIRAEPQHAAEIAARLRTVADPEDRRLGEVFDDLRGVLLGHEDSPLHRLGTLAWRAVARKVFDAQQSDQTFDAISYAVLDGGNYLDRSLSVYVKSVEAFFDATDPAALDFVDALIAYEREQELNGAAFVGYAALRFTRGTRALLGPQLHPLTCAVEVAGLADVKGGAELVRHAEALALASGRAVLHWGQQNEANATAIADAFAAAGAGPRLEQWRTVLAALTQDGQLDGFSSAFTRKKGLEVLPAATTGNAAIRPNIPARSA